MISFIIIGRNEGKKLIKCFESVFATVLFNQIKEYEVIYVDSNSSDNSIEIVKQFKQVKIFKITGVYNAAIGRNIGYKESKGDILFFIDGDMELFPEFLANVIDEKLQLKYDFVSGQLMDYLYDDKGNYLINHRYHTGGAQKDKFYAFTGGIFLIKRKLWESVNGMKNKYKNGEDFDLGLRLAKEDIFLLRKKEMIAKHHTISYMDNKRKWKMLFDGSQFYVRGLLYREHLFNKHVYALILRNDWTLLFLLLVSLISFITETFSFYFLYVFLVILRSVIQKNNRYSDIIFNIPYYILRDILTICSFLFFYPPKNENLEYIRIS